MHSTLSHSIYRKTRKSYLKLLKRYKRNKAEGQLSRKKEYQLIQKLKKLFTRLRQFEMRFKMGFIAGGIAFALSVGDLSAQELGPFIQNDNKNPFRSSLVVDGADIPQAVDIDGDGDLDITVGIASGYIQFIENVGTPTNPNFVLRSGGLNPFDGIYADKYSSTAFGDFDGDGDLDLLLGNNYGTAAQPLELFENMGNATTPAFDASPNSPAFTDNIYNNISVTGPFQIRPEVVDIDNDGDLDIFGGRDYSTNDYSVISLWLNDGSNNFTEQGVLDNPLASPLYNANLVETFYKAYPAFVDIDGDGDYDCFVGSNDGVIRFFENTGTPEAAAFSNEITGTANPTYGIDVLQDAAPEFADFDGDGDFDLVVGSYAAGEIAYFENIGTAASPNFIQRTDASNPFSGFYSGYDVAPTAVDLDGDGFLDVVLGIKYDEELRYFQNDQNGEFIEQFGTANPFDPLAGSTGERPVPAFADIDNDGDKDLFITSQITAGPTEASMRFFRNNSGTFVQETSPVPTTQNYTEFGGTIADFDGDADFDVLLGGSNGINYSSANFQFLENQGTVGTPSFVEIPVTNPPINNFSISTGFMKPFFVDIDHDGDPDVVSGISAGAYDGQLFFFENDGTSLNLQTGTASPFFDTGPGVNFDFGYNSQPALLDTDNDGDLDVIIGIASNEIIFLENSNESPQITNNSTINITYTENDPPLILATGLAISDDGNDLIRKARIVIENYVQDEDFLDFVPNFGTSGSFMTSGSDAGSLIIDVPPAVSYIDLATVINSVTYVNVGSSLTPGIRNIRIEVIDFDNTNPTMGRFQMVQLDVVPLPNELPIVATSTGDLTYTENSSPIVIDNNITVSDLDNTDLESATITITNFESGEDILEFTDQNGITGSFDTQGVLTLSGTSTVENYQTALRSITYANSSDDPNSIARVIEFVVNDGEDDSAAATKTIQIVPINDPPSVVSENAQTGVNYTQNEAPIIVDDLIELIDPDNENFSSASITISNFESGDVLDFTPINDITGSFNNGTLTLIGPDTNDNFRTAIRSVSFSSENGSGTRDIEFIVNDGMDNSSPYIRTLTINDAATLPPDVNTRPATTQEGSIITIDLCEIISDPDNSFDELTIEVISILSNAITSIEGCDLIVDYSNVDFSGRDEIVIRATDPDGNSDENTLEVTVEEVSEPGGELQIYNAVSPNGDGANDWWEIENLSTPNTIELYNRWGDSVKSLNDYDGSTPNNQLDDLPAGTYFYQISSPEGQFEGFIVIKK